VLAPRIDCVLETRSLLGEGPIWDTHEAKLYWVDIRAPALLCLTPSDGKVSRWAMPSAIGCVALRASGGLLVGLHDGLYGFDTESEALSRLVSLEPDQPQNRLNDGKCDRYGRFWIGTMHDASTETTGSLYRVDRDRTFSRILKDIGTPNSVAWSPDNRWFYFADTRKDCIRAYAYDLSTGSIGKGHVFAGPGAAAGRPDGATVDEVGCLWSARYGGGAVVRFMPNGRIDRIVELPVRQVTSCAFGGHDLSTLYVTTSRWRLTEAELASQPLAGGLFAITAGVRGVPETPFAG